MQLAELLFGGGPSASITATWLAPMTMTPGGWGSATTWAIVLVAPWLGFWGASVAVAKGVICRAIVLVACAKLLTFCWRCWSVWMRFCWSWGDSNFRLGMIAWMRVSMLLRSSAVLAALVAASVALCAARVSPRWVDRWKFCWVSWARAWTEVRGGPHSSTSGAKK